MIIKFDHISFSCGKEAARPLLVTAGYELQFQEQALKNISCKQAFFHVPHAEHDIYMYEKPQKLPIEITMYDTCFPGIDSMSVENHSIVMYSTHPEKTSEFLSLFGLKKTEQTGDDLMLEGRFALGGVTFGIRKADAVEWKLDKTGWSSVGFLSSNVQKELDRVKAAGYEVTCAEELEVNHRRMNIGFCKGPLGEIIEIISLLH